MNRHSATIVISIIIVLLISVTFAGCMAEKYEGQEPEKIFEYKPVLNDGKKWRVAYYEGGPYINYPINLKTIAEGLMGLGWMEETEIPYSEGQLDAKAIWDFLSGIESEYLEFVPDAYWSADWNSSARENNRDDTIKRLQEGDIDFIIAMGTWAGQDLANNEHSVPTMVVSCSDPVKSGISKSTGYSGLDHVHAKTDPLRYTRQVRFFKDLIGFDKLGVVYEDTVEGRSYAAIENIESVAEEKGFELVLCKAPHADVSLEEATEGIIRCHEELAPDIDAVYLTVHRGIDLERMDEILAPLMKNDIPTWSQRGSEEVKKGVLLSISRGGFKDVGRFHAEVMAKIFNGIKPGDISQLFEDSLKIAINMDTAEKIGYGVPPSLMVIVEEVYGEDGAT